MYLQVQVINAIQLPQCKPDLGLTLRFAQCTPEDELYEHYHVFNNVPLKDVHYFAFAEEHRNLLHNRLKTHFASALLTARDVVAFESFQSLEVFSCGSICILPSGQTVKGVLPCTNYISQNVWPFLNETHFKCMGWDNTSLLKGHKEILVYTESLKNFTLTNFYALEKKLHAFNDHPQGPTLADFAKRIPHLDKAIKAFFDSSDYQLYFKEYAANHQLQYQLFINLIKDYQRQPSALLGKNLLEMFNEILSLVVTAAEEIIVRLEAPPMIARNRAAISTLKELSKSHSGRSFLFFGASHLFPALPDEVGEKFLK